jgi:hypothetical protein
MMGQRKLDGFEKHWITSAATSIRALMVGCGCEHRWDEQFADLLAVADSGTTDGKPYVEPQPEIGDGYRRATESDAIRQDAEFWSQTGGGWQRRKVLIGKPLSKEYHYRVPVDRIPTDEDAVGRPTVMVSTKLSDEWLARPLLAVTAMGFLVKSGDGFTNWKQARFPYPGELD